MGGMIAQHIAIEHAPRVLTLTSIMSAPGSRRFLVATRPRALKTLFSPPPRTIEAAGDHAVKVFTLLGGSRFAPDADNLRRLGRLAFERGSNPRGFLLHFAAICSSGSRVKALARVRVPTLVFHGAEDPLIPVSAGRATARAIPGARLHVVPGMGHHMPPGVWNEMVSAIVSNAARA
jgi:pimeloyl-ACP methyl ester carboxylesterase